MTHSPLPWKVVDNGCEIEIWAKNGFFVGELIMRGSEFPREDFDLIKKAIENIKEEI